MGAAHGDRTPAGAPLTVPSGERERGCLRSLRAACRPDPRGGRPPRRDGPGRPGPRDAGRARQAGRAPRRRDHPHRDRAAAPDLHHADRPRGHPRAHLAHGRRARPGRGVLRAHLALRDPHHGAGRDGAGRRPREGGRRDGRRGPRAPRSEGPPPAPRALHRDQPARERRRPAPAARRREALHRHRGSHPRHQVEGDLRLPRERDRPLRGRGERHRRRGARVQLTGRRPPVPRMIALVLLVGVALAFDFMNGFHDAANSIATIVSTRVLTPRMAVAWAAFFNFVAAFGFGVAVATTVGKGIVQPEVVDHGVIFAGLAAAFLWDLITWRYGLPSSSSHALIAGLAGAGLAKGGVAVLVPAGLIRVVVFIVVSPLIGFLLGAIFMLLMLRLVQRATPATIDRTFRRLQLLSAAGYSL